jgi:Putative Flp pilus-assembly TadE/G-like
MQNMFSRQRTCERGQTIIFVAISLVSLLAMAALAIDIVTLYVAKSEIQRATDATALAAAKAISDSGFTTLPTTDANYTNAQTLAQTMAVAAVNAMVTAPINVVGGQPVVLGSPPAFDFTSHPGSYQVTIKLKSAILPTFFSKIWGGSAPSVTATATAEAYNPSNLPTITPIAPINVKPWLVGNADPTGTAPRFVDTTSPNWVVDSGVIGKSFDLVSDCNSGDNDTCHPLTHNPPRVRSGPLNAQVEYVPAVVTTPNTQNVCPSTCVGATDYERSIECADVSTSYQVLSCGGGAAQAQWDDTINPGAPPGNNATALGGECLIHASSSGLGQGQDSLTEPGTMFSAPYQIHAQSGATLVSTSNSIITIPIIDTANPLTHDDGRGPVTVVGFLQAFVNEVDVGGPLPLPPPGSINIRVLNIAGCSPTNNGASPVVGASGTSPVPVRLIAPP